MTKEIDMSKTVDAVEEVVVEAPIELTPYTIEELDQMVPEYLVLADAEDQEGAITFLKSTFKDRNEDALRFAELVYAAVEVRNRDRKPADVEVATDEVKEVQEDRVDQETPDVGSDRAS